MCLYSVYITQVPYHVIVLTDAENKTKNDNTVVPILIAITVVLLSGVIITVVVYIIVKRFRKSETVSSGEMTIQSPNIYSTASSSDVPNIFRERKVNIYEHIKIITLPHHRYNNLIHISVSLLCICAW